MNSIRKPLQGWARKEPPKSAHRGLWLDRFLPFGGEPDSASKDGVEAKGEAKAGHLRRAARLGIPEGYERFVAERRESLEATPDTLLLDLACRGRMAVGLGRTSTWENGLTLHRTWGMPVIPGSSLKGLAAHYAHRMLEGWEKGGDNHRILFGCLEEQGLAMFHDALFHPAVGAATGGVEPDVLTVHHREYYQGKEVPPADWDSPVPVPFLSVVGEFLGAISLSDSGLDPTVGREWLLAAQEILSLALDEEGIGAKTSSGYGRISLAIRQTEAEKKSAMLRGRVDGFVFPRSPGEAHGLRNLVQDLESDPMGRVQLPRLIDRVQGLRDKDCQKVTREILVKITAESLESRGGLHHCLPADWKSGPLPGSVDPVELEKAREECEILRGQKPKGKDRKLIKRWTKKLKAAEAKLKQLEQRANG